MRRPDGHCSVEENPPGSGNWRVRARVDGSLTTLVSGVSHGEAESVAAAFAELRNAKVVKDGLNLKIFGKQFLDRRELDGVRGVQKDRYRWNKHVTNDPFGKLAIKSLDRNDIKEWLRRKRKLAYRSKLKLLILLKVCLDEALDHGIIKENPAAHVKVPTSGKASAKDDLEGILTPDEQRRLLEVIPEVYRAVVVFALATGLRQAEQWWLQWTDISNGLITVQRSTGGKPPKSGKPRPVYMLPAAAKSLQVQANLRRKNCIFVFPGRGSVRRQEGKAPYGWKNWLRAAGITRNVRWHDLRHTCATSLLAGWWGRKWSIDEVCKLLGHSSISVTERYAKKLNETLRDAVTNTPGFGFEVPTSFLPTAPNLLSRLGDSNPRPVLYESTTSDIKKQRVSSPGVPPRELQADTALQTAIVATPGGPEPTLPESGGES